MKLLEIAKGQLTGTKMSDHLAAKRKQYAGQQQTNPQQQQPVNNKPDESGFSPLGKQILQTARDNPKSIPSLIDALAGMQGASQHFESVNPMNLLAEVNNTKTAEYFFNVWKKARGPRDIASIIKLLQNDGIGAENIAKIFSSAGIKLPQQTKPQNFNSSATQTPAAIDKETIKQISGRERMLLIKQLKSMLSKDTPRTPAQQSIQDVKDKKASMIKQREDKVKASPWSHVQ